MSSTNEKNHGHHITPLPVYFKVWGVLILGTILTVISSYIDFGGSLNIFIAMLIATVKASLVILFFMGLKYEGYENNVTFFGTFFFLGLFLLFPICDIFFRPPVMPVRVDTSDMQAVAGVDFKQYKASTPELVAKGKALFAQNCVACHGPEGKGDGPAAASLTPKPRNFTAVEGWKNGREFSTVYKTISTGIQGTPMPSFAAISIADRLALAHFIRSLMPTPPEDKPEQLAALEKEVAGSGTPKPRLTIDQAIDKVANEWEASHK